MMIRYRSYSEEPWFSKTSLHLRLAFANARLPELTIKINLKIMKVIFLDVNERMNCLDTVLKYFFQVFLRMKSLQKTVVFLTHFRDTFQKNS